MSNEVSHVPGPQAAQATVLGQRQARIPTGGKIRAGIKVLTRSAASNPKVKEIYEQGIVSNSTFEEIGRAISQAFPGIATPLVPKNVPWFTVRPNDFPNPEVARQILDLYGEDRGDGVVRLYRFPVIFPSDSWQSVMPHELVTWTANEKRYWSEYAVDGMTRYCKTHSPAKMDHTGRRAIRTFGGRSTELRAENNGICDPENCREYQNRQCNLSGRFLFFIPGIKSIDAFELQTNSFYAMSKAIERFETMSFLRGGRLSGFLDEKHSTFYITKRLREVPHLDDSGRPVRTSHWLIELEAPIDVSALLAHRDDEAALRLAESAAQTLQGEDSVGESQVDDWQPPAPVVEQGDGVQDASPKVEAVYGGGECEEAGAAQSESSMPSADCALCDSDAIAALAEEYGIDPARYLDYADKQWGNGWRRNPNGCQRVKDFLKRFQNDPDGLAEKIDIELGAR